MADRGLQKQGDGFWCGSWDGGRELPISSWIIGGEVAEVPIREPPLSLQGRDRNFARGRA